MFVIFFKVEVIVNILASKPEILLENIVAFTFTKRAAEELKSRIYHYGKVVLGHNRGFAHIMLERYMDFA